MITWSDVEERLQPCYNFNYHKTPPLVSSPSWCFLVSTSLNVLFLLCSFVIPLSLCCDQLKSIIVVAYLLLSPLYPSLPFSPSFIFSFSYHIIDHLKSINFLPFLSFLFPSFLCLLPFFFPCLPLLSSKALRCQRHFTRNPSTVQTHSHMLTQSDASAV